MVWHHVKIPTNFYNADFKFFIEKCKANTRTISVTYYTNKGDVHLKAFERITYPDLIFVTTYRTRPEALNHNLATNFYCVTLDMGRLWSMAIPNQISPARICLGTAKPDVIARVVADQPPRLIETFWNTDFTAFLDYQMIKEKYRISTKWKPNFLLEPNSFVAKLFEHSEVFRNALQEEN